MSELAEPTQHASTTSRSTLGINIYGQAPVSPETAQPKDYLIVCETSEF